MQNIFERCLFYNTNSKAIIQRNPLRTWKYWQSYRFGEDGNFIASGKACKISCSVQPDSREQRHHGSYGISCLSHTTSKTTSETVLTCPNPGFKTFQIILSLVITSETAADPQHLKVKDVD